MMKKLVPILFLVLFALAGCNRGPATYKASNDGKNLLENCETFVNKTVKQAPNYTAEDWKVSLSSFSEMCKDYKINEWQFFEADRDKFADLRMQYATVLESTGNQELMSEMKQIYSNAIEQK